MRSYGQYCGLARGLDVIGDRWVLLIVRELLNGPRRYGELLDGLPGVATNLLAERLRAMQADGLVIRTAYHGYALTERGLGLREVVFAIGRWALPLGPIAEGETYRSHWIAHPVAALFPGADPSRPG
jgi:DNA-binding HxlR family transcriptional regulator